MNALNSPKNRSTRRHPGLTLALSSAAAIGLLAGVNLVPASYAETTPLAAVAPWDGYADLIEEIMPSVVAVSTEVARKPDPTAGQRGMPHDFGDMSEEDMRRFMERYFNQPGSPGQRGPMPHGDGPRAGTGSGFIIDQEGLVVTNNHVIQGADSVTVTLNDDREFEAEVIGADPDTDLALLRVESDEPLPVAAFADSDEVRVGDAVIAIGNPFGLGGTVTAGIVSAKAREIGAGRYDQFLQIDAPINRGNSGGPTFNLEGEVIGVNTAIHSPTGGNVGIGFAIPANLTQKIVADLEDDGQVERGWIGVHIQGVDDDLADGLGLPETGGALVARVSEGGPAEAFGIEQGDVITGYRDVTISSLTDLTRAVADTDPGQAVDIAIWRDGAEQTLSVEIAKMPSADVLAGVVPSDEVEESGPKIGLALAKLDDETRAEMDLPENTDGALVTEVLPGSPAAEKGLRQGDVIIEADQQTVTDPATVAAAVKAAADRGEKAVLLLVKRGDRDRFVAVRIDQT